MRRWLSSQLVACSLVLALAAPAAAQDEEPSPGIQRSGLVAGVQGGWGMFTAPRCDDCDGYFSGWAGFHVGAMIGSRLALLPGVEWGGQDGRLLLSFQVLARLFLVHRWWADAGVGGARVDVDDEAGNSRLHTGISLHLAGGYDIYQGDSFAFDASLRGTFAMTDARGSQDSRNDAALSLQLGLKWY